MGGEHTVGDLPTLVKVVYYFSLKDYILCGEKKKNPHTQRQGLHKVNSGCGWIFTKWKYLENESHPQSQNQTRVRSPPFQSSLSQSTINLTLTSTDYVLLPSYYTEFIQCLYPVPGALHFP